MAECSHAKGEATTAQAVADAKVAIERWSDEKGGWGECGVCDNRGGIAYMCGFYVRLLQQRDPPQVPQRSGQASVAAAAAYHNGHLQVR